MTMVETTTRHGRRPGGVVCEPEGSSASTGALPAAGEQERHNTAGCGRRAESPTERAIQGLAALCLEDLVIGEWDELLRVADHALGLCDAHEYRELRWHFWFAAGVVAAARGQQSEALDLADRIDHWGGRRASVDVQLYAGFVRCQAAEADGDYDRAFREISVLGTPSVFSGNLSLSLWASLDFVTCAVRAGQRSAAEAFVALTAGVDAGVLCPRLRLLTACAASIAETASTGPLLDVASAARNLGRWPFDLARVELACGERLRRGRCVVEARKHLIGASTLFRTLGAQPWARTAEQELRATGGPISGRKVAQGTALTPQEQQIAELAACGLSNREIAARIYVSPRTVSAHLYRVFPKLGISSRAALRDALSTTVPGRAREAVRPRELQL